MRVVRTILGMLMLTIGIPALLVSAGLWTAMQHRDAGGAFSGELQRLSTPGYAIVVNDLDGLLRNDVSFARVGDTRIRLNANAADGPAFLGIAPAGRVAAYLAGVPRSTVSSVDLGTGVLPVAAHSVAGTTVPKGLPGAETFWTRAGAGALDWNPADLRDGTYSLVIMSRSAQPQLRLAATAEVRPGWLNTTAWAGLMLGSLLVLGGLTVLAWPMRRREIVYVVEPSQVPELMKTIGASVPVRTGGGRHAAQHRPRTLADAVAKTAPAAPAQLAWPPATALATGPTATGPTATRTAPVDAPAPAPGQPLSLINPAAGGGDSLFGRAAAERAGRRSAPAADPPIFEASAVGAWVAETAAARARETEALAAAAQAAVVDGKKGASAPVSRGGAESAGESSSESVPTTVPAPSSAEHDADPAVHSGPVDSGPAGGSGSTAPAASGPAQGAVAPDSRNAPVARQSTGAADGAKPVTGSGTTAPAPTRPSRPPLPSPAKPTLPSPARPSEPSQPEPAGPGTPGHSATRQPAKFSRAPVQDLAEPAPPAARTSPAQRSETPPGKLRSTTQSPAVIADTASAENMGRVDPAPTAPTAPLRPRSAPAQAPSAPAQAPSAPAQAPSAETVAEAGAESRPGRAPLEASAQDKPVMPATDGLAAAAEQLPSVVASSDDPDSKLAGDLVSRRGKRENRPIRPMIKPASAGAAGETKPVLSRMLSAITKAASPEAAAPPAAPARQKAADKPIVDAADPAPAADSAPAPAAGPVPAPAADPVPAPAADPVPAPAADAVPAAPADDSARTASAADPVAEPTADGSTEPVSDAAKATESAAALAESARLAAYQIEAAELLAGSAANRKRRTTTASGLPAPDPATQEAPFKLTRPPRPGLTKPPKS